MRTRNELLAAAADLVAGAPAKKSEILAFMTDLIEAWVEPQLPVTITSGTVSSPRPPYEVSPVEVHVAPTGAIFLDETANRFYTPEEAISLAYEILARVEAVS